MDFTVSEEQQIIKEAARNFAIQECLPGVIERDENAQFPLCQIQKLGSLGFMGMMVPQQYGGSGLDTVSYVLALEEICAVDASVGVIMSVNNSLVYMGA